MAGKHSYSTFATVALVLGLASSSRAQGNENAPCTSNNIDYNGPVNATGSIPFKFAGEYQYKDDWYLSIVYNATDRDSQWLHPFISVPGDPGDLRGCIHWYNGQNKTSEGAPGVASESCNGVLEERCIEALRTATAGVSCNSDFSIIQEACGNEFISQVSTGGPINWPNETCRYPEVPGVDLPDGDYHSLYPFGEGSEDDEGSFVNYDLDVSQTYPFVITGFSSDGNSQFFDAQVICLSPSDIQEGSRDPSQTDSPQDNSPQDDSPQDDPPSAAMKTDAMKAGSMAFVAASLAGLALMAS